MKQTDLFGNEIDTKRAEKIKTGLTVIENGEYIFLPHYFNKEESDLYFTMLKDKIEWKQNH